LAREQMALAATYAGIAFTRANVGYVHAIAHQLGGKYHTPHGLANAIVLPHVLRFSRPAVVDRLAQLALQAKLGRKGQSEDTLAQKFLDGVDALSRDLQIPLHLDALQAADIPALAKAACKEAHSGYPVPRYLTLAQCETLIAALLPPRGAAAATAAAAAPAAGKTARKLTKPSVTKQAAAKRAVTKKATTQEAATPNAAVSLAPAQKTRKPPAAQA